MDGWYHLYHNASGTIYSSNASIQAFLELDYTQFISAIEFLYPEALFSTEHGVKGEEYDNVIFVISKGWNMYQFETYAPMITGKASIPSGKQISFERNRNLFYVCCSRPRKRLFFFVTVPIDRTFKRIFDGTRWRRKIIILIVSILKKEYRVRRNIKEQQEKYV